MRFLESYRFLLDFIYPSICIGCELPLAGKETLVCDNCWKTLRPVNGVVSDGIIEKDAIDEIRSGYYYDKLLQEVIHHLKYSRATKQAGRLAERMSEIVKAAPHFQVCQALVAIPLNGIRLRERGYNQAELLAREVGSKSGIDYEKQALRRVRNTASQTTMATAKDRVENVHGVFEAIGDWTGKAVIIVDDLITTGSTANAAARALKNAGAVKVYVLTAGRPELGP